MAKVELQFGKNPVLRRLAQGIIVEQLQEIGVMQRELRQPPAASVSFIDTASNSVNYVTYVGRSPHEAFFTPDGKEVWVSVRGENYIAILDGQTYREKSRIEVPNGPGMTIFSPDGKYGYVCSSFSPETVVIATATKQIVGRVKQESPFCPDIAATPDGKQVWFTLKDIGKVMVFNALPPFEVIKVLDTGPITNHVICTHCGGPVRLCNGWWT
jgi:DNA-binding beta-propeller fold protein YncE